MSVQSTQNPKTLPRDGLSPYRAIAPFISISRETWRQLVRDGKAPAKVVLSARCVMYRNSDVHAWLEDPTNYRVEVA